MFIYEQRSTNSSTTKYDRRASNVSKVYLDSTHDASVDNNDDRLYTTLSAV